MNVASTSPPSALSGQPSQPESHYLPKDVVRDNIFPHLDARSLGTCSAVNKDWQRWAGSAHLWKTLAKKYNVLPSALLLPRTGVAKKVIADTNMRQLRPVREDTFTNRERVIKCATMVGDLPCSPDGTLLIPASDKNTATLRNVASGEVGAPFPCAAEMRAAFSTDSSKVAVASAGLLTISDVADLTVQAVIAYPGIAEQLEFSTDARHVALALARPDGVPLRQTRIIKVTTGKVVASFETHSFSYADKVFTPDGKSALTVAGGSAYVINLETAERRCIAKHESTLIKVAIMPDGQRFVAESVDLATITSVETGEILAAIDDGARGDIHQMSPSNKTLDINLHGYHAVKFVDVSTGEAVTVHQQLKYMKTYSLDDRVCAAATSDNRLMVVHTRTGELLYATDHDVGGFSNNYPQLSSDGNLVAAIACGNKIVIGNIGANETLCSSLSHQPIFLQFSPNGTNLVVLSLKKKREFVLYLVDVGSGRIVLEEAADNPHFSGGGQMIAFRRVRASHLTILDCDSGKLKEAEGCAPATALKFSPDNSKIAVANRDGTVSMVDAKLGKVLGACQAMPGLQGLAFTPDGCSLITFGDAVRVANFA